MSFPEIRGPTSVFTWPWTFVKLEKVTCFNHHLRSQSSPLTQTSPLSQLPPNWVVLGGLRHFVFSFLQRPLNHTYFRPHRIQLAFANVSSPIHQTGVWGFLFYFGLEVTFVLGYSRAQTGFPGAPWLCLWGKERSMLSRGLALMIQAYQAKWSASKWKSLSRGLSFIPFKIMFCLKLYKCYVNTSLWEEPSNADSAALSWGHHHY